MIERFAEGIRLYLGDCWEIFPALDNVDAVISDPPYGMRWNTDSSRYSGGKYGHRSRRMEGRSDWGAVTGDDVLFNPALFLDAPQVILWGANHFSKKLPVGTTLV